TCLQHLHPYPTRRSSDLELGKEQAHALTPATDTETIDRWQQETEDAVKLDRMTGGIPVARFENIYPHLKRLDIGASLNGLEIARSEEHTSELQSRFDLVC